MLKAVRICFLLLLFSGFACKPLYHPAQTNPPQEISYKKLSIRVITQDKGYPLGGPVDLKLEIENISEETFKLNFDSNQLFDFKIYRKAQEVWRWSNGKNFEKTRLSLSIYPGEVWTFKTEWDAKDNQRRWVLGGRYHIEGILNSSPPLLSEQVEIGLTD